jgi:signal peptidase I
MRQLAVMQLESEITQQAQVVAQANLNQSRAKAILRDITETVALFLVVFTLSQVFLGNFMIEQRSAYPHFVPGDRILVDKLLFKLNSLQRGDMIVGKWQSDSIDVFKRVIGLPGETIKISNNKVFANGVQLNEKYLEPGVVTNGYGWTERTLGPDEYFVMGDNRMDSGDSRQHGPMQISGIVGRAWLQYWPLQKLSLINNPN